jgi:hypothetical protein
MMQPARGLAIAAAALLVAEVSGRGALAPSPAAARRSSTRGFRVGVGLSAAHVRPEGQPSTVRPGPALAVGWGFNDYFGVGSGLNVAYGVRMIGRSEPFGRLDLLTVRYTHARRSWPTLPFAEAGWAESFYGNDDETSMSGWHLAWRVGAEHHFTLGTALELSVSPSSGTLDDRDIVTGAPATRSQRFRSVAVDARVTFRPSARRRLD